MSDETVKQEGTEQEVEQPQPCRQCEDYLAGWKRAQADYANLKKEMERLKLEYAVFGKEQALYELLPVIDQFTMAVASIPNTSNLSENDRAPIENWFNGIRAIQFVMLNTVQSLGIEKVASTGEFNPSIHEAVSIEVSSEIPDGHIIHTVQSGWQFNGKLLRPAKVIVAKAPNQ